MTHINEFCDKKNFFYQNLNCVEAESKQRISVRLRKENKLN